MNKLEKYLMENEFDYEWFMAEFKPVEIPKEFDYANELIIFTDGYLFSFECRKVDKDRFYEWNDDKKEFIKVDSLNDIQQAMDFIDEQADEAHTEMSKKVISKEDSKKMELLEDLLEEKFNMEISSHDKGFITVEHMMQGYERCLNGEYENEFKSDKERIKHEMELFKEFVGKNLYTTLCVDIDHGGCFSMANVICDADLNFVDLVVVI